MRKLLIAATALALSAGSAMALPSLTGDINFDGSDTYNATSVTFIGNQGVSSGTGSFVAFGTCAACITAQNITYSPFVGPLNNFLAGTNGGVSFALDLNSVFNIQFVANNDLDFDSDAVLHLTGFADTPGTLFFSSQGPNDIEVSFSATAVAAPEPAGLAVLGVGLLGLGFVTSRKRRA
jgi:hypothetical protein